MWLAPVFYHITSFSRARVEKLLLLYSHFFHFRFGRSFRAAGLEFLHAAGGIDKLLFACVEWMAVGADLNFDLGLRSTDDKGIATRAGDLRLGEIGWMRIAFHNHRILFFKNTFVKFC